MRRASIRRRRAKRRGAAAVEFAIAATVLFLMVFGIIEFGRMLMVRNAISNAAREGCRAAALATTLDPRSVNATVARFLDPIVPLADVEILVTPTDFVSVESEADITVQVSIDYSDASWLSFDAITSGLVLRATSTQRRE